jgi:hypothetical protein
LIKKYATNNFDEFPVVVVVVVVVLTSSLKTARVRSLLNLDDCCSNLLVLYSTTVAALNSFIASRLQEYLPNTANAFS